MQNGFSIDKYPKNFDSSPFEVQNLDREDESKKVCNFITTLIQYFLFD